MNNIVKPTSCTNGAGEVGFGQLDGGEGGEFNAVGFVETFKIVVGQDELFLGTVQFDRVHWNAAQNMNYQRDTNEQNK